MTGNGKANGAADIIIRAKLIKLLMPCHNTPSGALRKKHLPSQEYKDLVAITILVGMNLRVKRLGYECFGIENRSSLSFTPSSHLWNSCPTTVASVIGHYSK